MRTIKKATTKELLSHAFNMMQLLKQKAISVEEAKEHSNLLKQSNNILKYELDRAKAISKYDDLNIREVEEK